MKGTETLNLEAAFKIAAVNPDLSVGFDLVDNEDTNDNIWDYRDVLITMRRELRKKYKNISQNFLSKKKFRCSENI